MADQYDNTDSGAAFKPFETQQFILQGKVNNAGRDDKIVLVKDQTKNGTNLIEVFQKVGVLFENDKKGNDNAPDYTGPIESFGRERRLAAWRKMKDGNPYMSMKVTDKNQGGDQQQQQTTSNTSLDDDKIPF